MREAAKMQFYLEADNVVIVKLVALCSDQSVALKETRECVEMCKKS